MTKLSVVIPTFNEEKRIPETLRKIHDYFIKKYFDWEITIVDDGSTDKTILEVEKFSAGGGSAFGGKYFAPKAHLPPAENLRISKNPVNRGKGYAVKRGMLEAGGDWILFTDADLSTPIEELDKFLKFADYDVLVASRALADSKIAAHQPRYRELGGRMINFFVRLLAVPGIRDTQCGFKLFRREAAKKIFERTTIDGWGFDIEALYLARKYGFKIKELPVTWTNDINTKVHPFKDGLRIIADIVRIKINNFKGHYSDTNTRMHANDANR